MTTAERTPTRWRGWHPAAWFALVAVVLAYAVAVVVVTFLAVWGLSTTCGDAPTAAQLREARLGMLALVGCAFAPWAVTAVLVRPGPGVLARQLLLLSGDTPGSGLSRGRFGHSGGSPTGSCTEEVPMSVAAPESAHEHDWRLVAVDYDEFTEVSELQCSGCAATHFV